MTIPARALLALVLTALPSVALANPFVAELNAADRDYLVVGASLNEGQIRAAYLVQHQSNSALVLNLAAQVLRNASPTASDFATYAKNVNVSLPPQPQGDTATALAALKSKTGDDLSSAYVAFVKTQSAAAAALSRREVAIGHQSNIVTLANLKIIDWTYLNNLATRDQNAMADPIKMGELSPRR